MSRLSEDILANIDIVDIVSRYVQLKRVGRNFVGLSPFRNEKTPSFTVSPEKQIFKCFSTGIGGNAIKFIMEIERIDYWDAAQILVKDAGLDIKNYQTKTPAQQEKREKEGSEKEKYKLMFRIAQQYFLDELEKSPTAKQYLHEQRHLTPELIKTWGLGYAPDSSFGLPKLLREKGFSDQDMQHIRLANKKEGGGDLYSFYRNRITFPIYDHLGTLVGFGGRVVNPEDQPKYLNGADSILYDKSKILYGLEQAKNHLKTYDKLVVVEGYMDVIGFARLGFPIAVATCGTALTPQHMKLLKRYTPNIYLMFDNDAAGQQATVRALKVAYQHDVYPKMLSMPEGHKDIDERANISPTEEEVQKFFDGAVDAFSGIMEQQYATRDVSNPVERKIFLQMMFDVLLYVQDMTILTMYTELLAKKLRLTHDVVFSQFKTYMKTQTVTVASMRKEQDAQSATPQQDKDSLFYAFFYNSFLQENGIDSSFGADTEDLDSLMLMVVEVAGIIGDEQLLNVVSGDVGENHSRLLESQLWWEKHRGDLPVDKKILEIKRHCEAYIQNALKMIIKMKTLSAEEKQDIIKRIKKVK